ncbi:hypothetical protein HY091_02195 [Candidatus Kaiserbacteria bacterium]|nr:hypothetical protein [Candidatus Kaiserbacteria bacterium]
MKTLADHIDRIKAQPHHIRKQVAFGIAAAGAAIVGLIWFFGAFAGGAFAIQGANFAESTGAEGAPVAAAATGASDYGVAGAAAAIPAAGAPATIQIVDAASSTLTPKAEQTLIPF